jgi:putative ABC transport system permease protein
MKIFDSVLLAFRSLAGNKMRSILTMLGIIIGVGAVISLMSVGNGAQSQITAQFESLGSNQLTVMPSSTGSDGGMMSMAYSSSTPTLTLDDAQELERIPGVEAVVPINENLVSASYGSESATALIHGAGPGYLAVYNHVVEAGQFISERNLLARDLVVVLGNTVASKLFNDNPDSAVGQKVKILKQNFRVIGVLEAKGGAMMGMSYDDLMVVPITTYQTKLFTQRTANGEDSVQSITVKAESSEVMDDVKYNIETILRKSHSIGATEKDDFSVVSMEQMLSMVQQVTMIFTLVLGAIAGISLLVGGIGIMNIMLVSVTERTREIGVRKAVGAKRRDILAQFLIEASMLSLVGGSVGILLGLGLSVVISFVAKMSGIEMSAVPSLNVVLIAVAVSIGIGLISGVYPAMRASRLNPIDALHYG